MNQRLILPLNHARLTASWKTEIYRSRFGFSHYGIDLVSSSGQTLVYASGEGEVLAAGWDNIFGNIAVLRYNGALNHITGRRADVICRMFHFDRLLVQRGRKVNKDTKIGYYGNTGQYSFGAHLHLEADTDTAFPFHTPSLSGRSTFFSGSRHGATDTAMLNPLALLHCKASPPDNQRYTAANGGFIHPEDLAIPIIK